MTVTTPADTGDTANPSPKLTVPAEPTTESLSLISIPVPEAITPIKLEPSIAGSDPVSCAAGMLVSPAPDPENDVAVATPETFNC